MADFDGDGIVDLISGSNCCRPYAFHVWPGRREGLFGARQTVSFRDEAHYESLEAAGRDKETLDLSPFFRRVTHPRITDWDGDGRSDLVMGTSEIFLFPDLRRFDFHKWNRAYPTASEARRKYDLRAPNNLLLTRAKPSAQLLRKDTVTRLPSGNYTSRSMSFPCVRFYDWDGDGRKDALAIRAVSDYQHFAAAPEKSNWRVRASLVWFRNLAKSGGPEWAPPRQLYAPDGRNTRLQSFDVVDRGLRGAQEIVIATAETNPRNNTMREPRLDLLGPGRH